MTTTAQLPEIDREQLVRRGLRLSYLGIAYNLVEGVIALAAGIAAGSVALVGFGLDSFVELTAAGAAVWRLRADFDPQRRRRVERRSHQIIGATFLLLAVYVTLDAVSSLVQREAPDESPLGIAIAVASLIVMPILVRAKRRVARGLSSKALSADAQQTALCTWLSAILLGGLALNAVAGWWWADPIAALVMVPIIVKEGWEGVRAEADHGECC